MARPERNNVDYFPHPVTHGKKMFYLRSKYKNDGYAVWFMLLEELGKANHHYLDFKDETQIMFLSSQMMVTEESIKCIIEDLVKLGEFDFDFWNDGIIYCQKFTDSIEDAYSRRSNNVLHKRGLRDHLICLGRIKPLSTSNKGSKNPQSIVKDSKVKKSKEDIPTYSEFKEYALSKKPNVNIEALQFKYEAWKINGWKDGNDNQIKNWKSKLLNTLPHIKEQADKFHPSEAPVQNLLT